MSEREMHEQRLAAALRDNLRRRKTQERERAPIPASGKPTGETASPTYSQVSPAKD